MRRNWAEYDIRETERGYKDWRLTALRARSGTLIFPFADFSASPPIAICLCVIKRPKQSRRLQIEYSKFVSTSAWIPKLTECSGY